MRVATWIVGGLLILSSACSSTTVSNNAAGEGGTGANGSNPPGGSGGGGDPGISGSSGGNGADPCGGDGGNGAVPCGGHAGLGDGGEGIACSSDCSDGLGCTADRCLDGRCVNEIGPEHCVVDDTCVLDGAVDPQNPCQHCDPDAGEQRAYSPRADGESCGNDLVCFEGDCVACNEGESCDTGNPCESGTIDCTSGQPVCEAGDALPVGTPCNNGVGVCGDGQCVTCPTNVGGGAMVPIADGYCIDATEVSMGQYDAWLATNPGVNGRHPKCSWNTSYVPNSYQEDQVCSGTDCSSFPQVGVNWCDAHAYCQDMGKRLCGAIGGAPFAWSTDSLAAHEFVNACTSGGQHIYPYGDTYHNNYCQVETSSPTTVTSPMRCLSDEPGYQGAYNLVGNVDEWMDECESTSSPPEYEYCRVRGARWKFPSAGEDATCEYQSNFDRAASGDHIGFRCCWSS